MTRSLGRRDLPRRVGGVFAAVLLAVVGSAARAQTAPPDALPAWGLAVSGDGTVFAADGTKEPGVVWSVPPTAWAEGSGEGPIVLAEAPGLRDLQLLADGSLLFNGFRRPARESTDSADGSTSNGDAESALFRRSPDGATSVVIPWQSADSLFSGPPFLADAKGGVYFFWGGRIRYRAPEGGVSTFLGSERRGGKDGGVGEARFNSVRTLTWSPGGDVFLVDAGSIRRIDVARREVETMASRLLVRGPPRSPDPDGDPVVVNRIYGLAVGSNDRIFAAYHGDRTVLSIRRSGKTGAYYAPEESGWSPVGVAWDEGTLYVLETRGIVTRELRLTRISPSGRVTIPLDR